jgi:hypothetical protein
LYFIKCVDITDKATIIIVSKPKEFEMKDNVKAIPNVIKF